MGKIQSDDLADFAAGRGDERRSVIIEVKMQPVRPTRQLGRAPGAPGPTASASSGAGGNPLDDLEREVARMELDDAVRIESAGALVVDVTPPQLRRLAELPGVAVIRPNRTHRVGTR